MTFEELKRRLEIKSGAVTVGMGTLTSNIDDFLKKYNNGQSILITNADNTKSTNKEVVIEGRSNYMGVSEAKTRAVFALDQRGDAQAIISFQLIGAKGTGSWDFLVSFPDLPGFTDVRKSLSEEIPPTYILKEFQFYYTYFILSTQGGQLFKVPEEKLNVPLELGINFGSKLHPSGLMGALEAILGNPDDLNVSGTITIPAVDKTIKPLRPNEFPWDNDREEVPGISLKIDLDIDKDIGSMLFKDVLYRIYSPLTNDWLEKYENWSYLPVMAYVGDISIPNAGINAHVTSKKLVGTDEILLNGDLGKTFTFNKLADLVDLTGDASLDKFLPKDVRNAIEKMTSKLYLKDVAIDIIPSTGGIQVPYTYFTIGADVKWSLADGLFELDGLAFRVIVTSPFSSPKVSLTIMSEIKIIEPVFDVKVSYPGFLVYIQLDKPVDIPLTSFLEKYADNVPAPLGKTDLSLDNLVINVDPGKLYSVYLSLGDQSPLTLDVGKTPLVISDISLRFYKETGQRVRGNFSGVLELGAFKLSTSFDLQGAFEAFAQFPNVTVNQLIGALCNNKLQLPEGFDLSFENATVLIKKREQTFQFLFGTQMGKVGSLAFELLKDESGKWGFAFGIQLSSESFHAIEGLSIMKKFTDFFHIQNLVLAVSSIRNPFFQFPDFSVFKNPKITDKRIVLPAQSGGLKPGFFAYSQIHFGGEQKEEMLKKFFGISEAEIGITVFVGLKPQEDAKAFFSVLTHLDTKKTTTIEGKLGIQLTNGEVAFYLDGTLVTNIQGKQETFHLTLMVVPNGAFISGEMTGEAIEFGVFQLANIAVVIGIDLEGIPSFGFACEIEANGVFDSSVAIFLDSVEPINSMVAGAVSDLNLGDVVKVLTGNPDGVPSAITDALKSIGIEGMDTFTIPTSYSKHLNSNNLEKIAYIFKEKGGVTLSPNVQDTLLIIGKNTRGVIESWFITDLTKMRHYQLWLKEGHISVSLEAQFQCVLASGGVTIGQGIHYEQGIFIDGVINFFALRASLRVDIENNKGISFDANISKITIIDSHVFEVSDVDGKAGPQLSLSTFAQPERTKKEFRDPHFFMDGSINILGIEKLSLFVSITKSGFIFKLKETHFLTHFDCSIAFMSLTHFSGSGHGMIGVDRTFDLGVFGNVKVDAEVDLGISVVIDSTEFECSFEGGFEFEGLRVTVAKFELAIRESPFKNLGLKMIEKIPGILINFLATGCGMTQALGALTENSYGIMMEEVFHELKHSQIGQELLYHYYLHDNEINSLLKRKPEIAYGLQNLDGTSISEFSSVLDLLKSDSSERLHQSIELVEEYLTSFSNASYDEFLSDLE